MAVVGLIGIYSDNIIFVNNLLLPDIPTNNQLKKIDEEKVKLSFIGDLSLVPNDIKELAEKSKQKEQKRYKDKIVTEIILATEFYDAEEYHQKYLMKNGGESCGR